jgi:mRNA-degrading endonuclease RelE of RelBE toxin-antitoxin system
MEFIETPIFTREIRRLLPDDEYHKLQIALVLRPDAGDLIRGSGGLRKIRWRVPGKGKRGSLRVIYYWYVPDTIFMLLPYEKSRQKDLTPSQLKTLKRLVEEWLQ